VVELNRPWEPPASAAEGCAGNSPDGRAHTEERFPTAIQIPDPYPSIQDVGQRAKVIVPGDDEHAPRSLPSAC